MEKALYERIKSRRKELHLSQEALARKMDYSDKSMISKIEKGKVDLSESKIMQFANVLQTSPEYLMGWIDDPNVNIEYLIASSAKDLRSSDILDAYWKADKKIQKAVDILLGIELDIDVDFSDDCEDE
jgi:transcriptional regulator with XRE-family HTH domain